MRTDLYAKTMLTVIAACLVWLCLGGPAILSTVQAQTTAQTETSTRPLSVLNGWLDSHNKFYSFDEEPLPVRQSNK